MKWAPKEGHRGAQPDRGSVGSRKTGKRLRPLLYVVLIIALVIVGRLAVLLFTGEEEITEAVVSRPVEPNITLPPTAITGKAIFVAPDGTPAGDGSIAQPLDLATALSAAGPAHAGDVIWLRGGSYPGPLTSSLSGSEAAPIIVGPYGGERVTIEGPHSADAALTVSGAWTWYWGLEITNTHPLRVSSMPRFSDLQRGRGVVALGQHLKFINMIVHDTATGFQVGAQSTGTELYGNIVFHNGWQSGDVNHGHGIETENREPTRQIRENIIFNQFSHGVYAYGKDLDHIRLEGNAVFNNGLIAKSPDRNLLLGGGGAALNPVLIENMTYYNAGPAIGGEGTNLGYGTGCRNAEILRNYFTGSNPLNLSSCTPRVFEQNVLFGRIDPALISAYPNNQFATAHAIPPQRLTGTKVFVRPNKFESGRANIMIFNWDKAPRVTVDLAAAGLKPGDQYEIRDVHDYFGPPVASETFAGGPITIAMTELKVTPPIGAVPNMPAHPAPEFGAFVVTKAHSAVPGSTTTTAAPVLSPAGGLFTDAVDVTLASPTNGSVIRYTLDGSVPTEASPIYERPLSLRTTSTVTARAFKAGSVASASARAIFTIEKDDSLPPTVAINSPAPGQTVGGTFTVTARANDNVGVTEVRFLLNGLPVGRSSQAPYSAVVDTKSLPNGSHLLTAAARDAAGNQTTSAAVRLTVQNATR
jgi:hypothetical protein